MKMYLENKQDNSVVVSWEVMNIKVADRSSHLRVQV